MLRSTPPWFVLLLALVLPALRPAELSAATINFLGTGKGATVEITSPTLGDLTVRAGEMRWQSTSAELATLFYAYCVDATQYVRSSQLVDIRPTDELTIPGVDDPGGKVAWLVNTYGPVIHDSGTDIQAAALQIAIWTATYNNDGEPNSGPFRLRSTGPVATEAQVMLDHLFDGASGFNTSGAAWLSAAQGQSQVIPTPEPGALLLTGTGLLVLWRSARKRRA